VFWAVCPVASATGENQFGLSSTRVATLRESIFEAAKIQKFRDEIAIKCEKDTFVQEMTAFLKPYGLTVFASHPANGWISMGDDTKFTGFCGMLERAPVPRPIRFIFSLLMGKGLHMWAGSFSNDGLKVFDPDYGEFWSRTSTTVLNGLYDVYQVENSLISHSSIFLVQSL